MFGRKARDRIFFETFTEHARRSVEAATQLLEMFEDLSTKEKLALAISEKEAAGDPLAHDTVKRLHETWITPLDRYDVHGRISKQDDVLDLIEAVSERMVLFEIAPARSSSRAFS